MTQGGKATESYVFRNYVAKGELARRIAAQTSGLLPRSAFGDEFADEFDGAFDGAFDGRAALGLYTARVRAVSSAGLRLEDDAGGLGVFVEDGGQVGVGTDAPAAALHVRGASPIVRIDNTGAPPSGQTSEIRFYENGATLKGRLLYAGGNPENQRYFGFINDAADDLRFFSDLTQWWSSSAELARLASTGLFTLRYGKLDVGGAGVGNSDASVRVGVNRGSGAEGLAYLDLFGDNSATYGARLLRRGGANGNLELVNNGTGETLVNANNTGGKLGLYVGAQRRLLMPPLISLPYGVSYDLPQAGTGLAIFTNLDTGGYGVYAVNSANNAATPIVMLAQDGFRTGQTVTDTINFTRTVANPATFRLKSNFTAGTHRIHITWIGFS